MRGAAQTHRRVFSEADQTAFAELSGDWNPLHMDRLAARRTQVGACAVHGIHGLLWALDTICREQPALPRIAAVRARFVSPILVGNACDLTITRRSEQALACQLVSEGVTCSLIELRFGIDTRPVAAMPVASRLAPVYNPSRPIELALDDMDGRAGRFAIEGGAAQVHGLFPSIAARIGAEQVVALAATSYLVGMVCPGLHSIFGSLDMRLIDEPGAELTFAVARLERRFRQLIINVAGGGIAGRVEAFARLPPIAPPSIASLAALVDRGEFAGVSALVIGGSRGVGAVTAKLLAAGGARVGLTYASGKADAETVGQEIRGFGAECSVFPFDVSSAVEAQFRALDFPATDLYYNATPKIFGASTAKSLNRQRLNAFNLYYIDAFSRLADALIGESGGRVGLFYPSTVALDEWVDGMLEYCMAKAAGEILCQSYRAAHPELRLAVPRLPRMLTDQTATIVPTEDADIVAVMLPLMRQFHDPGRAV